MSSVKQKVLQLAQIARKVLERDGYHQPIFFCLGRKDFAGQLNFSSAQLKEQSVKAMTRLCRQAEARQVILISESWVLAAPSLAEVQLPVRHNPHRQEALSIAGLDATGQGVLVLIPFSRLKNRIICRGQELFESQDPNSRAEFNILSGCFPTAK